MNSILKSRSWLKRVFEIPAAEGPVLMTYNGRALGTENVSLNNAKLAARSEYLWFVPRFEFVHNNDKFVVQVRVWPWLTIRSLTVHQNDELIYSEGGSPYTVTRNTEAIQATICFLLFVGLLLSIYL
jgi:hypothetical protein